MFAGGMQELVLEVDVHLNFQVTNMRRKLVFDLSRMSILSQAFQEIVENEIQIPHFSSVTSNVFPSDVVSGGSAEFSHHGDRIHPVNDASCSRDPGPQEEFSVHNSLPEAFRPIHQNYILKQAGAVISVEKPLNDSLCLNEVWVGSGSISCFDITISLSEIQVSKSIFLWFFLNLIYYFRKWVHPAIALSSIKTCDYLVCVVQLLSHVSLGLFCFFLHQMLLSMISSFSGVFKEEMISEPDRRHQSSNEEFKNSSETMIPNGIQLSKMQSISCLQI